tara:strand:- start:1315 stop:1464 length:150 start_codon:yes stop_codon:yes gene_type:complete
MLGRDCIFLNTFTLEGFDGTLGMEYGNSRPDKLGWQAVIDAYIKGDQFL